MLNVKNEITTCGTSLFNSCCWDYDEIPEHACWDENKIERDKKRPKIERKCYDILKGNFDKNNLKEGIDLAPFLRPGVWEDEGAKYLRDMPAELASLKVIEIFLSDDTKSKRPLGFGDKVILLHSSNAEGLFCAKGIYETLKHKKLLPNVEIKMCPVEGLDHSDAEKYSSAPLVIG